MIKLSGKAYLVLLVFVVHATLTFLLCNNLAGVFHNDLVRAEAAVASHSVAAVGRLDHFDADTVLASLGTSRGECRKCSVGTCCLSGIAVDVVALIKHDSVLAVVATAVFRFANALGIVLVVR